MDDAEIHLLEVRLPIIAGDIDVILGLERQQPEKPVRSIILAVRKRHGAPGPLRRAGREPVEESDVVLADRGIIEQAEERGRDALEDAGPRRMVVAGIRADRGFVIETLDDHAVVGGEDVHVIPAAVVKRSEIDTRVEVFGVVVCSKPIFVREQCLDGGGGAQAGHELRLSALQEGRWFHG